MRPALLAVPILAASLCAEEPFLRVPLPGAPVEDGAWSAPETMDGRACRTLKAGARGLLPVPVWWGKELRPGGHYLAKVEYKDTAAEPIVAEVFAGLPGHEELHRFGGLADGQWKTAHIPLPWDLVMRKPGTDGTELIFRASAEVPVAEVAFYRGRPEADEARWCTETRDWVARVQGASRDSAKLPEPETPALSDAWAKAKAVPFPRPYAHLLYPTSAPREGEAGGPLRLRQAQNEIETAQFGVYAHGKALQGVAVELDPAGLTAKDGGKLDASVELFAVEYSVVGDGSLYPQRLWPMYAVDIPAGRTHAFWINVETFDGRTRPGTYAGKLLVKSEGKNAAELPLEVEVLPFRLLTMNEADLDMGACVPGMLPFHELKEKNRHNHNSINLWYYGIAPEIVKKSKTEFDLDFTLTDDFMKRLKDAGMRNFVYFLGGDPYGAPDTWQLLRELYRKVHYDGTDMMEGRKLFIKEFIASPEGIPKPLRELYKQWVRKFYEHAQAKGWPEPILTPFDEPAKWSQEGNRADLYYYKDPKSGRDHLDKVLARDRKKFEEKIAGMGLKVDDLEYLGKGGAGAWIKPHFKDACAAIHEAWPKARIYGSIHHADTGLPFLEDIDVFCTNAIHEDNKLGDKVRAGGKRFWQYSGTNDRRSPAEGRYAFGFFFASFNSRGSLCWAYNWGRRFDTREGSNWLYAWTTPYSVVRAPFWEGVREAWDDRRYIETLRANAKKAGASEEAEKLLAEIFDAASKTRTAGGRDTVSDFYARSNDPDALETMRGKIIEALLKMK